MVPSASGRSGLMGASSAKRGARARESAFVSSWAGGVSPSRSASVSASASASASSTAGASAACAGASVVASASASATVPPPVPLPVPPPFASFGMLRSAYANPSAKCEVSPTTKESACSSSAPRSHEGSTPHTPKSTKAIDPGKGGWEGLKEGLKDRGSQVRG